jgi:hypothetical protein
MREIVFRRTESVVSILEKTVHEMTIPEEETVNTHQKDAVVAVEIAQ